MAAVALDTHRIVQRLRAAGFDERQAETVTDVMIETRSAELVDLATKADLKAVNDGLDHRVELLEQRVNARFENLEQRMNARFEGLEQRMTIKLGLMMVAGIAAVATLVKLL